MTNSHQDFSADIERACAKFVMWCLQEGSFQGCDINGGDAQEKAVELGLLDETTYDSNRHGVSDCCEQGDPWYVPKPDLIALLSRDVAQGPVEWRVRHGGQWLHFENKAHAEIYAQGDDDVEPLYAQPPAAPVETATSSDGSGESRPASTEPQASASRRPQGLIGEAGVAPGPSDPQCSAATAGVIEARRLLAAEDARQDKLQEILETIREQIRLEIQPENRPDGLFKNIQDAVYAMRGRTRLIDEAAIIHAIESRIADRRSDSTSPAIASPVVPSRDEERGHTFNEPQGAPVTQNAAVLAERLIQAAVDYEAGRCSKREMAEARAAVEAAIQPLAAPTPAFDALAAEVIDRISERYNKLATSPLGMATAWERKASGGKPYLYGGKRGMLAQGSIATWGEFDLIVDVINNLPTLLAACSVSRPHLSCACKGIYSECTCGSAAQGSGQ